MGSFVYISICALLCYLFLFITFLFAKKSKLINAFLAVLASLIAWSGFSVLMRMRIWPGIKASYDISLLGMWMFPCTLQFVVRSFMGEKYRKRDYAMLFLLLGINAYNILTGKLLAAPTPVLQANGETAFVYTFGMGAVFLYAAGLLAYVNVVWAIVQYGRRDPAVGRQFRPCLIGISALLVGHVLIVLPVFSKIPLDIVAGVINAVCLFYMLYRRRLFKLTLLASRRSCYMIAMLFTFVCFAYLIDPIRKLIAMHFNGLQNSSVLIIAVLYAVATMLMCTLVKRLIDQVFVREEQSQAKMLEAFSLSVSKSLRVDEILDKLIHVIQDGIQVRDVYICMRAEKGAYRTVRASDPLTRPVRVFTPENPLIAYMKQNNACLMMQDLHIVPGYRSLWEEEKRVLQRLNVRCMVPLLENDDLVGVVLLSDKEKGRKYTYSDESFLTGVRSVASIGLKNANLYEKAYHDARTDDLTGLMNRKYFHMTLNEEFEKWKSNCISLMILNVDDFKLYNQLYGNHNGDLALRSIAGIIENVVGENGIAARYSGKEFAVILPGRDVMTARRFANNIREHLKDANRSDGDYTYKALTMSIGICAAPYGAVTVKQLLNNTEQAVYQVKRAGKNAVCVYAVTDQPASTGDKASAQDLQALYSEFAPTVYALTAAIDAKDHYTFRHSNNVAYYATRLASALGMDVNSIEILNEAALLHDVGKIGVAESILNKAGRLTEEEYEEMKKHVDHSVGIIRHLPSLDFVIPAVIGHHERYDGTGYPRRISGDNIPLYARILCVADSFDAMTSKRVYKEAYSVDFALEVLEKQSGKQFDPRLAEVFVRKFRSGNIVLQNAGE